MTPELSVIANGRSRLLRATDDARARRFRELLLQLEVQHQAELRDAGFFRRRALQRKMRDEAEAIVRREFGIPSDTALFVVHPTNG